MTPGIPSVAPVCDITSKAKLSDSEFAGATFSPGGDVLFVNIQGNGSTVPGRGMTCAISGPWHRGAL
jgi:uncharacterized protein